MHRKNLQKVAEEVIQLEINALKNLKKNINNSLVNLIKMIINCKDGKIIISGVGKVV